MIYTVYSQTEDMTFIMEQAEGTLAVKGFYFGQPTEELTKTFYGSVRCEAPTND